MELVGQVADSACERSGSGMSGQSDEYERSLAFSEIALGQIKALRQPAYPRNYEVWYAYATGYNPTLNQTINETITRNGTLSATVAAGAGMKNFVCELGGNDPAIVLDESLEPGTHFENLLGLGKTRARDNRATIRALLDQAFNGQPRKRCPHNRATDTKALSDGILG